MRTLLIAFAIAGLTASPAVAQPTVANAASAKAKTVKKVVCQKVQEERTTGSRLGATTKVCKTVEVSADEAEKAGGKAGGGEQHAH